jgi:hypothetical protein
MKKDNG